MFARQHRKQRFQVDLAQPPRRGRRRFRIGVVHGRAKRRIHVEPPERTRRRFPAFGGFPPFPVTIVRRLPRLCPPATSTTLAQQRIVRRGALLLILSCVMLAAAVGSGRFFASLVTIPHTHEKPRAQALARTVGGPDMGQEQTQRNLATRPFASLELHVSANGLRPPVVRAAAAFLFDPNRGWIFYEKNADEERPVASLAKVMTLLVASGTGDLDQSMTIGPDAAALVNGANSYMGVSTGEQLTLRDLLYGLVTASGNDAAVAIADAVGGTEASFVAMMNRRAWRLGLTQTVFVTPDGVDDGNRSTARDLAVLAAIALEHPGLEQITATRHYTIPRTATHKAYELWSGNDLLPGGRSPYLGANGVKTGYTAGAVYCLAFSARRQGHLLVGVVLGAPSAEVRARDAQALLDWGFAHE
jgi:serine-type D-Ala-D-Ala carboxypeptidase (penicillin-binding protein 5/6)